MPSSVFGSSRRGFAQGIAPIEATRTIGVILAIGQISQFVTPPLFGWLADRVDRLTLLIAAMGMTAVAFGSYGLIGDVFSVWMMVVAVLVGLAEGAQSISANAVLGEECPRRDSRGGHGPVHLPGHRQRAGDQPGGGACCSTRWAIRRRSSWKAP